MIGKDDNLVDIVVVRTANSIIYDPRVKKIIASLSKKYLILALGWNRDALSEEKINNYMVKLELFKLKTSVWKPSLMRIFTRLLIFFPPFWMWVLIKLLIYRPKVVHACDLDSILPCYIYKILFRKKLVFDIFDRYAMAFIPPRFKRLYSVINFFEEFYCKHSDALIIAGGEKVLRTIQNKPKHFAVLMNCPQEHFIDNENSKSNDGDHNFKLVYTGGIRRDRALESVAEAIRELNSIDFVIAGPIIDKKVLLKLQELPNVKYQGLLSPIKALTLEASSDVLVALYSPEILWNSITLPNKLFEAMMCGIPIITNVAPEIVNETACGIMVEYDNVDQIKETIIKLRDDPKLRKRLGENGRNAFLQKYNWDIMEQRLYKIYDDLLR
jgi:glycosyltransferase involved in cell wall biosynthesis